MTTKFLGGPAEGVCLTLTRAPYYLRVVRDAEGTFDALDALDDVPQAGEALFCYRKLSDDGAGFVDFTDKRGRRCGRRFVSATYEIAPVQPAQEVMRDRDRWTEWTTAEYGREKAAKEQAPWTRPTTTD